MVFCGGHNTAVMTFVGEPGVGKSRFAAWLRSKLIDDGCCRKQYPDPSWHCQCGGGGGCLDLCIFDTLTRSALTCFRYPYHSIAQHTRRHCDTRPCDTRPCDTRPCDTRPCAGLSTLPVFAGERKQSPTTGPAVASPILSARARKCHRCRTTQSFGYWTACGLSEVDLGERESNTK